MGGFGPIEGKFCALIASLVRRHRLTTHDWPPTKPVVVTSTRASRFGGGGPGLCGDRRGRGKKTTDGGVSGIRGGGGESAPFSEFMSFNTDDCAKSSGIRSHFVGMSWMFSSW